MIRLLRLQASNLATCLLTILFLITTITAIAQSQEKATPSQSPAPSDDEEKERVAAERFLEVLIKRPTTGTALDKVFGYHVAKGDLGDVLKRLIESATASKDDDESGRYWMLIGLLQLERGEDAEAAKALGKAQEKLSNNSLAAFHHGQALLLIGEPDAAAVALQTAMDRKPPKAEYLTIGAQLGRLYQRAGKVDAAIKVWNDIERTFPNDDGVRHRIAATLAEEGDLKGALARYDALAKTAKVQNDQMVFAINAADLRIQLGQKEQATKDLETLLTKLRPNSYLYDDARRRIETAFLSSGDYAGLAEYYDRWVKDHKDDIDAVLRLARVLSIQGRSEEAIKWFEQSIERAPTDTAPRLAIIDAYLADSRFADAAKQYEQLVASDNSNPDYLVRWGQVLMSDTTKTEAERQQAAAAVWKRLAAAKPKDAAIQTQVADLLRGAKLTDDALAGYQTAISLAPDEPQHKEYLGEYLNQLGRKDEALEVWRSLAAGKSRNRENLIRLSEVLHQFEQGDEALKTLAEACEMRPKVHERLRYAEWLREAQKFDQALEQIELARTESETVDERDRVFTSAVQTYQAAGQLTQRIEAARQAAEKTTGDSPEASELWRQLAVLFEANRQTQEALEAIDKAVQAAPTNIETLDIAARMFEEAGRLPQAIEKRRLLANTDRRFRNGHLQRLASLYIQSGDTDAAITAGREMLSGAGGAVDAFKFYAEICGQAGREDERIDTLRRCLRLNPRSEDAQQLLAKQLAEDFKTEQAIELYWKMLDAAGDIEKRRDVVKKLADLYLRTNRLDQLIGRIELRGRESGDRRTAIDLTAAAYQQAGDLGLAREALEGLLRESGRDTLLLERLVGLAEQSGEVEKAIELQRQLLRLAPGRTAESRLASLLIDIGATEEAQAMWLNMVEKNTDVQQTAASIDRLFAAGESKVAIELCTKAIENHPEDWETRFKLAVLLAETGDWGAAAKVTAEMRAIKLDDATLPAGAKPKSQQPNSGGANYPQLPIRMMRIQNIYELLQILDERYGYQARTGLPKPIDFGHAKMMATYIEYRSEIVSGGDLTEKLAELEKKANEKDANAETLWSWFEAQSIASTAQQTSGIDFQDPSKWSAMWKLAELDSAGEMLLIQMFANRQSYAGRSDLQSRIQPLSEDKLAWVKAKADDPRASNALSPYGGRFNWGMIYATELRIANKPEDADLYSREQVAKAVADGDATNLLGNLQFLSSYGSDDQLWSVIQKLLQTDSNKVFQQHYGGKPAASMLSIFAQKNRVDQKLSKGAEDKEFRQRLMQLCDALIATETQAPAKRKAIRMTGIGGIRSTYRIVGGSYEQLQIHFPPQGLGPEDDFVQAIYSTNDLLKDHFAEWMEHLDQSEAGASDRQRVMIKLTRATLLQWNEKPVEAIAEIKSAIELATEKAPTLEPELRLMLADLLLRQDLKLEALQAIEQLSVYDQNTMAIREFSAAKLAATLGNRERAQAAAKRLFGVRLDTDAQVELAKLMRSLDMRELAADLVRRLRSRGGSNTDQLRTLMTYFQTQDEKEQAAEVAMELLQRTAPTRATQQSRSRSITTAESQLRKTAMQTLAASGKLSALIEATEKRLEQSPKSQRVRAELSELYAGAGKADKAAALFADAKSEDLNSTSGLEAAAKQFVAIGKLDAACDAYLKILRRKPQLFQSEFYEIKRPFDQTKRIGELADLVIEVGLKKFEGYRIGELCSNLLRENKDTERARKLYLAMLDVPPTANNAMYSLNNVLSNARELLKDRATLEKTVQYLINSSKNSTNDWSTLFQGYSTGSDGRHNNATTSLVRAIAGNEEFCDFTENSVRETLKEKTDWYEGKAWLGLILTARKKYDEAKTLLEPLANKETKPQPSYDALWLIGSLIDEHKPMQELAASMYDYAMSNTVSNRQSDFQYSLESRACKLLTAMGRRERARELILQAVEKAKKGPKRNFNNDEYEAYEQIRTSMSMMDMLSSADYPADALRVARGLDRNLFAKAGQYQRNLDVEFEKKQKGLLEAVRKLGGLQTIATMIDQNAKGISAVDFGITYGESPFSQRGIQSLWIDLVEEVQGHPEQTEALAKLVEQLKGLAESRKLDDSATGAWALAADIAGDREPLRALLSDWMSNSQSSDLGLRHKLLVLATLRFDRGATDADANRQLIDKILTNVKEWEGADQLSLLAELGRQSLMRKDSPRAKEIWTKVASINGLTQMQMLDLALAAANADFADLSIEVASASAKASGPAATNSEVASKAGSLGELLGSNRVRNSGVNQNRDEPDTSEVQLAKKIIELDDTWSNKKISPEVVTQSLIALTLSDAGRIKPLFTKMKVQTDSIAIDSVFDRLAKHAHEAKLTKNLLASLKDNNSTNNLLAAIVMLRDQLPGEAKIRLEAIEPESLQGAPKELTLQAILLALEKAPCRKRAVELGLALLDQNKPAEQYSEIQPFDTFSMILIKQIIAHNMQREFLQSAANHYLELTQHDNERYSGSYGFQRRASQLEEVAKLFLNKGNKDEALKYLGMRQPVFNMGNDQSLDWVGCWALESLQSNTDRRHTYSVVANWTFDGDGALNNIKTLARRQRLPTWIPESVGGSYPKFPPVADETLPIATNYYFLAKLAQETNQVDDLKMRYAAALEKDRAGAVEGLAIALATWKEPIAAEMLTRIEKRLDSIDPGQDRSAKGSMPFAEVQLASILAADANHAGWAKATFEKAMRHTHSLNRSYVHPWLNRFQYQHGWSDEAKLLPATQLAHWISSTSASAHDYYEGDTPANWVTDGDNRIDHLCGFGTDYMWFKYPLEGSFEFEVELPSGEWRESGIWCRGIRIASPSIPYFDVQGDEGRSWMRFTNQETKSNDWNKYSVKADGDKLTYSVNGKAIYSENLKSGTPWLALRSTGVRGTFTRNIKLTGEPTIPRSVELIQNGHLRGWTGVYYGQPLPSSLLNKTRQEGDTTEDSQSSEVPKAEDVAELSWTVKNGELISGQSKTTGPGSQSVVQYQRPLGDGESLSYEFFYEDGKTEVHPALGRTAFILRPAGLKLHWMTEPNTSWKTPTDYEVPVPNIAAAPIALKAGEWNSVKLERRGQTLTIALNGENIFQQPCDLAQGEVFGLFHYADKTSARVRNARLEGSWPETIPEKLLSTSGK